MSKSYHLVLGGSQGLGAELVQQLLKKGQPVISVARSSDGTSAGSGFIAIACDLSRQSDREDLIAQLQKLPGEIDTVYFCAAQMAYGDYAETSLEEGSRLLNLNVLGVHHLMQAALSSLKVKRVYLISSEAAFFPLASMSLYSASKAFLHQFGLSLYWNALARGVLVQTYVAPPMKTQFDQKYASKMKRRFHRFEPSTVASHLLSARDNHSPEIFFQSKAGWIRKLMSLFPRKLLVKIFSQV
ncbi:SDR family NAD(P)-dependent oxidoreductase [bacterium]|nr:SDR family NAD(P)-dependent oxidoreductase [bacterium]